MTRITLIAGLLAVATTASAAPLQAQSVAGVPVRFGITGGINQPVGTLGEDTHSAWNAGGLLSLGDPGSRTSLRLDGQWGRVRGGVESFGLACPSCSST